MHTATTFPRRVLGVAVATLALLVLASPARAQNPGAPDSTEHYKVYSIQPRPVGVTFPLFLRDQFGISTQQVREMEFFATPVSKNEEPVFDFETHYDWWRLVPPPTTFSAIAIVTNQFGDQQLRIDNSEQFLLAPSLKFPQPGQILPIKNHYKCYHAEGKGPQTVVTLRDQFGFNQAYVDSARWFCTPVEKEDPQGFFPIIDSKAQLTCYRIVKTPPTTPQTVIVRDQFGFWQFATVHDEYLCVPTLKNDVVPTTPKSWGSMKAMYR